MAYQLGQHRRLLREMLPVLRAGGDFQLGPKGKHRDLIDRIEALLAECVNCPRHAATPDQGGDPR